MTSAAGEPPIETTVVEAIAELRAAGYPADFAVGAASSLRCSTCGAMHPAAGTAIDRIVRMEGVSNPDDEAIVFGLTCAQCGARGVLVAAYGPSASIEEAAIITALVDARA